MQVSTFLMFSGKAEQAMRFYASVLPDARIETLEHYGPASGAIAGRVQYGSLIIGGTRYRFVDSPVPHDFAFTPAISLLLDVDSEPQLTELAAALSKGGRTYMPQGNYGFSRSFAWVEDCYGVSWQLNLPSLPDAPEPPESPLASAAEATAVAAAETSSPATDEAAQTAPLPEDSAAPALIAGARATPAEAVAVTAGAAVESDSAQTLTPEPDRSPEPPGAQALSPAEPGPPGIDLDDAIPPLQLELAPAEVLSSTDASAGRRSATSEHDATATATEWVAPDATAEASASPKPKTRRPARPRKASASPKARKKTPPDA